MKDTNVTLGDASRVALPLRWVAALAAALIALGGGVAVAQARLATVEANAAKSDARLSEVEKAATTHAIHDAAVDADLRNIRLSLDSIDRKLDRMMEGRGLRAAGGRE